LGSNNLEFFKSKKILITGHTGFKGSWLTLWLTEMGANVIGYSLEPPTEPSMFDALNLKERIIHVIGDVRDEEKLKKTFKTHRPELVFHLAAQPLVRYSYIAPKYTYEVNVIGTINLLEAVRETDTVKAVVVVTSDKCYENKEWIYGYRETDPVGGYDPYSSSKGCAELVVSAYRRSYFENLGIALSSVRAGNVIGGGDWQADRLVPDCIRALSKGETIKIRNPDAIRPWQYVLEPLSGYLLLASKMLERTNKFEGAWNFGPPDADILTVEELVNKVLKYWGGGSYRVTENKDELHEARLLKLDSSMARFLLGWRFKYDVERAVKETVEWYKNYYSGLTGKELCEFSVKQIKEYESADKK